MAAKKSAKTVEIDASVIDAIAARVIEQMGASKTAPKGKTVREKIASKRAAKGKSSKKDARSMFKNKNVHEIVATGRYARAGHLLVFGNRQFSPKHIQHIVENKNAIVSFAKNGKAPKGYSIDKTNAANPKEVKLAKDGRWICTLRVAPIFVERMTDFEAYLDFLGEN